MPYCPPLSEDAVLEEVPVGGAGVYVPMDRKEEFNLIIGEFYV